MKQYLCKTPHGVDILSEKELEEALKREGFEVLEEIKTEMGAETVPFIQEDNSKTENQCEICGRIFKNAAGLKRHKASHK